MLTPEKIKAMNAVSGLNVPLDPTAPPSRAQQIQAIAQKSLAAKAAIADAAKPKLGQGAAGEFAGNALRAVASPLVATGGLVEKGIDQTLGRVGNAMAGNGFTPTHTGADAGQSASKIDAGAAHSAAGDVGSVVGAIAPYFTGAGEEETAAKVASMLPKLAEHLGVSADSLVPKVIGYLAKSAPTVAKNTAIGTAQTGSIKQGAEIGVGGQLASDAIAPLAAGAGKLGSQVLGLSTGSGASSIKAGFEAGKEGSKAFTDAMRGKIEPDEIVQNVQDAVQNIANNRRSQYLNDLEGIKGQTGSLDISPINTALQTQLKNFGVKVGEDGQLDFGRSSIANNKSARADVQGVYDTLKDWGTQTGDRTAVGLDTLKKQLGDFYSDSGSARALVQAVKGKVGDILKENVPGYAEMTQNYSKASSLLDDIKSATGAGGNAKVDTVFTKLTTAMKSDKDLRLEILREASQAGGIPELEAKIAGINMKSLTPKGLVGKGADVAALFGALSHVFNPEMIPALLSTSPRVVGEFVNALGVSAKYATRLKEALGAASKGIVPATGAMLLENTDQQNP